MKILISIILVLHYLAYYIQPYFLKLSIIVAQDMLLAHMYFVLLNHFIASPFLLSPYDKTAVAVGSGGLFLVEDILGHQMQIILWRQATNKQPKSFMAFYAAHSSLPSTMLPHCAAYNQDVADFIVKLKRQRLKGALNCY